MTNGHVATTLQKLLALPPDSKDKVFKSIDQLIGWEVQNMTDIERLQFHRDLVKQIVNSKKSKSHKRRWMYCAFGSFVMFLVAWKL